MRRAYKSQLNVNNKQITLLKKHCDAARWAFNLAIDRKREARLIGMKTPTAIDLHKEVVKLKKKRCPWLQEVSKCAPQEALRDCDNAFKLFFKRGNKGFPKFKSRKNEKQSFRLDGTIKVLPHGRIKLPRIGLVRLFEKDYFPIGHKVYSATISTRAGKWFVSISVEHEPKKLKKTRKAVGVDLGVKTLAVCSNGRTFANPKALKSNLIRLRKRNQSLMRKKHGSKNRQKAKNYLSQLHYKISNIRKDCLHKATTAIINENQVIILEDLDISDMLKSRKMSRAVSDVGMYEFRRQITYKADWYGREVIFADRYFPSSKMDHKTGIVNRALTLSDRIIYHSDGTQTDRDLNAAINLRNLYTGSSPGIYAFGDGSSVIRLSPSSN